MADTTPPTRRRWFQFAGVIFSIGFLSLLLLGSFWFPKYMHARLEAGARQRVRDQVAKVKTGEATVINLSNEIAEDGLDEFVHTMGDLDSANPFTLQVSYSHGVDDFLKQIRGLRAVRTLTVSKTDVTDACMSGIATLPDLENLHLSEVRITDTGLKDLEACPKLITLSLCPRDPVAITIPAVLALPHVTSLTLYDTDSGTWLEPCLPELEQATNLKHLELGRISPAKVEPLRARLPNCVITVTQ